MRVFGYDVDEMNMSYAVTLGALTLFILGFSVFDFYAATVLHIPLMLGGAQFFAAWKFTRGARRCFQGYTPLCVYFNGTVALASAVRIAEALLLRC